MNEDGISIRSIQHYLYCKHRWGLIEINQSWEENYYVTKSNILHERVHDFKKYSHRGKNILNSVYVYNDEYGLYGVVDCLEIYSDKNGVSVPSFPGKYKLCIVEYKPTSPKTSEFNFEDLMQVFAQKKCVDIIFKTDCDGVIYYADKKKRVVLPLKENCTEYEKKLKEILCNMEGYMGKGIIPPISKDQRCGGCSMKDMCLPIKEQENYLKKSIKKIGNTSI